MNCENIKKKKDIYKNGLCFMTEEYKINQMTILLKLWCNPNMAAILKPFFFCCC